MPKKKELDIEKYKTVQRWMDKIGSKTGSKNTKKSYLYILNKFCIHVKKNPDEIIKQRKKDSTSKNDTVRRRYEEKLMKFFKKIDEERSRGTAMNHYNAVKSFFKANYLELAAPTLKRWVTYTDKTPTLEEIKKMIDASESALQRAIILFSAQTGQRSGILTGLKYGLVSDQLEEGDSPLLIEITGDIRGYNEERVNKNRQRYYFYVGRDSIDALKSYIEVRKSQGEKITAKSPLFVTEKKFKGEFLPLDQDAINRLVTRAAIKAGITNSYNTSDGKTKYTIHHHCLRKFWQTAMEQAGVAKPWYDFMMGHSLGPLDKAYSNPNRQQLLDAYKRAEPYLSISRINVPEIDSLKKEMLLSVMKQQCEILGYDPNRIKIKREKEIGKTILIDEEIEIFQKEILNITMKNRINNNQFEHKIVNENELTNYLNKGWELVKELSTGNIVIKYPVPNILS